ncbi:hypothetical protein GGR32_001203 [Mesonia hippocampi]|uniref:RagB/SusD family nutrient uptake outer membrane protein n=1 Tax=Mesonia hippocampi TaxID=1628250 RepID=A0A840EHW8_9FLAO|nr:RagB/SusD family nutrient uptake outer membrane protein [Mesonia hippocampi]MBB4118912.1 hypothetical protein [Mesonia hippocampi]
MKNYIYKIAIAATLGLSFVACSDDFLDDPKPSDVVSEDVVFATRGGAETFMSGIIRNTRGQYVANAHDAGGLNSIYYARTVKGNDIIQAPTWFLSDYAHENREANYRRTSFTWRFSYEIINQLNVFIEGVENSQLSEEDKNNLKGQGLAMRAFYYFQLALEFQHTYTYDSSLPTLPIYKKTNEDAKDLSTMQEVYDFIIDDLTTAIPLLDESRLDKSYINVNVANAILARVYQTTHNWQGVEAAANAAYGGSPSAVLAPSTYASGFNDMSNTEWIWGLAQYSDQSNYYYGAPAAQADHQNPSYNGTYINANFVNKFSNSDVRKLFATKGTAGTWQEFVTTKFTFTFDADVALIRTPEMILAEAEAINRQGGRDTEAQNLLFAVQSSRDPNAVASGNTGDALLDEILLERRKELYGEMGVEWFDAKRYRKGITRDSNHRVVVDLTPDDVKFILKIPQVEIDSNDNFDASVNANK